MKFHDSLPNYDWDQMLPIGVTTEQLYQAFKARLMRELVATDINSEPLKMFPLQSVEMGVFEPREGG